MTDATMIDLTLSLDELTKRYGPEDGTQGSFRLVGSVADPTTRRDIPVAFWSALPGDPILAVTAGGRSRFVGDWTEGPRFVLRKPPLKFELWDVGEEADGTKWAALIISEDRAWVCRLGGASSPRTWWVSRDGTPINATAPTLVRKVGRMVLETEAPSAEVADLIAWCEAEERIYRKGLPARAEKIRRIAELLRRVHGKPDIFAMTYESAEGL